MLHIKSSEQCGLWRQSNNQPPKVEVTLRSISRAPSSGGEEAGWPTLLLQVAVAAANTVPLPLCNSAFSRLGWP